MRGHVDAEDLALGREGLLGRRRTVRIRAHLARCSRCSEVDAELAALPALLALTAVPPMPADLAARIDAVIAAEAASTQPADGAQPAGSPAPVAAPAPGSVPASGGRPPRGRPTVARKVLALAAAAVVVTAGGGYLLSRLPSSTSGTSASSAAAPATAKGPAARPGGQVNAPAGSGGFTVISSGTDYQPARLPAQIAAVLTRYGLRPTGAHASGPTASGPTTQAAPKQTPTQQVLEPSRLAALQGCVARITAGQRPWMVDESRYQGRPATIIVLAATARSLTEVWVVGPACSASRSDVLARTALPAAG